MRQLGMGSALDTLCGQSYGAKQYDMLGTHAQRAIFVLMLSSVPLAFVLAFTGQILTALGQNPEISYGAGTYARLLIPGLFAYGLLRCLTKFLQAQNIVHPLRCSPGNLGILLVQCDIASTELAWMVKGGVKGCELVFKPGHSIDIYDLFSLEYWAFEMVVLLAGFLPNPKLETSILSISLNTMWMVYTIPSGLSSAISIRVSNELGAGNSQAARLSVLISGIMCLAEGLLVVIITVSVRDVWGYLYSNEEEIVKYVSIMMPILATSNFMDGIQCTLSAVFSVLRKPEASCVNKISYCIVS
uniref:Protein TRANSPARENT TESTA 12 n=1 Tax=Aegilops tauschii TaxID=37682 RepID=M8CFW7_AEGTA